MAAYGYLVFLVRATVPHRSRALYKLNACGAEGGHLLKAWNSLIDNMGDTYQKLPDVAEGFRIRETARYQQATALRIHKGPEGGQGEAYNVETGDTVPTTEVHALLSGLRAKFYVPTGSYYGLLFLERVGGRHLKSVLADMVLKSAALQLNAVVRVEAFAEAEDWRRELADQQVLRVSEILTSPDGTADASTPIDTTVRVTTTGLSVRRASDRIKEVIRNRLSRRDEKLKILQDIAPLEQKRRVVDERKTSKQGKPVYKNAPREFFTLQDEDQYQRLKAELDQLEKSAQLDDDLMAELESSSPVNREGLETSRFDVALGTNRPERTFVVERDSMPQFVYETQGRLDDDMLRNLWDTHATKIFKALDLRLTANWLGKDADKNSQSINVKNA